MINLPEYRSNRSKQNCTGGELEWGRSILFDEVTEQWCSEHSDTVYAMEGYFPPKDRKTAEKIAFMNYLNLFKKDKRKILDIGTGAGQFMKLCMSLGHNVSGTEVQKRLDDPVYKIHQHYGLDLFQLQLMPSKYVFLPQSYDVITLLRTQFNDIRTREFKEKDWCTKGHIGFVIKGNLRVEFDKETIIFKEGNALWISEGVKYKHKVKMEKMKTAELILFENIL